MRKVISCVIAFLVSFFLIKSLPFAILRVNSGSMEPALKTGSYILVYKGVDVSGLLPGDIVVFKRGEGLVSHRIVDIQGEKMITKGDANNLEDPVPVTSDMVFGVCVFPKV